MWISATKNKDCSLPCAHRKHSKIGKLKTNYPYYPKHLRVCISMQYRLKYSDEMANSVDPEQTATTGAVWSGSAMFAQTY